MNDSNLNLRQAAAQKVEEMMRNMLMSYAPAENMRVCDVLFIARHASAVSFDAFDPKNVSP